MFVNNKALKLQHVQAFENTIFWVKQRQDFEHAKFTHPPIRQKPKIQQNFWKIDLKLSPKQLMTPEMSQIVC